MFLKRNIGCVASYFRYNSDVQTFTIKTSLTLAGVFFHFTESIVQYRFITSYLKGYPPFYWPIIDYNNSKFILDRKVDTK